MGAPVTETPHNPSEGLECSPQCPNHNHIEGASVVRGQQRTEIKQGMKEGGDGETELQETAPLI
jgi:cytochrome c-type biogenesis protein CcmH/NrfF